MADIYLELKEAADEILGALDQPDEFKRRLLNLIENAIGGNLSDDDARAVIRLAAVDPDVED